MARKGNWLAFLVTGVLAAAMSTSASAADLGGNCCADLEERIAELEATAARKGNRKVSLTVSGWVGQQIMFWDDGGKSNTYVHDLGSTIASHVKFSGQAEFSPGWTAGYVLHLEAVSSDSLTISQNTPRGPSALTGNLAGVQVLQSYWFIKSEQFGKLSVGKQSQPSDNTAILVDGSGSLVPANWVAFDVNGFFLRSKITGKLTNVSLGFAGGCHGMGGAWGDCNGLPESVVRYDTPVFVGFSASASWGENDVWDVAARYSGTFSDFKLALAAAYAETNDPGLGAPAAIPFLNLPNGSLRYFQAGAYAEHVPTGLFLYGAYGHLKVDDPNPFFATAGLPLDAENYYVKGGIRQNWTSLGHTVLYGEYLRNTDGILNTAFFCQAQEFQPHPSLTSGVWASFRKSMQQRCHYGSSTGMRDSMLMHFKMV